jgi:gas vesicle protein
MKRFMSLAVAAALCLPLAGCTEQQQLEGEIEDVQEQQEELRETEREAAEDIQQEREELRQEQQDVQQERADDAVAPGTDVGSGAVVE